ncbi:hypothetical protein Ppa06_26460 [Planomonospora parontospora subsp. parontospora]|nr:hypothetical protein Ppa06_26460 [Planomonospora parontospora subsp. parontospora]
MTEPTSRGIARSRAPSPGDPGFDTSRYTRHACAARAAFAMGNLLAGHVRRTPDYPAVLRYNA